MKIVLFGAGENGAKALLDIGVQHIFGVVDNHKTGMLYGCPIHKLVDLEVEDKEEVLFLITPLQYKKEIADELVRHGYHKFLAYTPVHGTLLHEALEAEGWSRLYNDFLFNDTIQAVLADKLNCWTREMIKITECGGGFSRVLEIGCGSGKSTLALARQGRICTAIDYSEASIKLLNRAKEELNLEVTAKVVDARNPLPFADGAFDFAFQAGLLEHFEREERIRLLKLWKPVCHTMVSMIPNAHSVPYRLGKAMQEKSGEWPYGKELPQPTLIEEFMEAGYHELREYTIGVEDALTFLPENHYMRAAFERWYAEGHDEDSFGQGYLLVTIGKA